jgi:hypothetical protein
LIRVQPKNIVCNLTLRTEDGDDVDPDRPKTDVLPLVKLCATCPKVKVQFNVVEQWFGDVDHDLLCALFNQQKSQTRSASLNTVVKAILLSTTRAAGVIASIVVKKKYAEDWMYRGAGDSKQEWIRRVGLFQGDENWAVYHSVHVKTAEEESGIC